MIKKHFMTIVFVMLAKMPSYSAELTDSVASYNGQTVNSTVTVQGKDTLRVSNVNVTSTGNLTLTSPDGVIITSGLDVVTGGVLNITGGKHNYIRFFYNNTGHRIRRENY